MERHKLLKAAYIKGTAQVGDEVEVPESEVQLYIDNGVIEGKKSTEPQTLPAPELPEGDILSPMRSDPVSETDTARVVPEEEKPTRGKK